jgi:hypothetical protein
MDLFMIFKKKWNLLACTLLSLGLEQSIEAAGTISNAVFSTDPIGGNLTDPNLNALTITYQNGASDLNGDAIGLGCGTLSIIGSPTANPPLSISLYLSSFGTNAENITIQNASITNYWTGFFSQSGPISIINSTIQNTGSPSTVNNPSFQTQGSQTLDSTGPVFISESYVVNNNYSSFIDNPYGSVTLNDSIVVNGPFSMAFNLHGIGSNQVDFFVNNSTITNYGDLGRNAGKTVIENAEITNYTFAGYGANFLRNAYSCEFINSTITNYANFAASTGGIVFAGGSISNLTVAGSIAEMGIGMDRRLNFTAIEKGTILIKDGAVINNTGRLGSGDGIFKIQDGFITSSGQMALGMSLFSMEGGSVTNSGEIARCSNIEFSGGTIFNEGSFGSFCGSISLSGSARVINQENGLVFFNCPGTVFFQNNAHFINELDAQMGPFEINMTGGTITNHGELYLGQISYGAAYGSNAAYAGFYSDPYGIGTFRINDPFGNPQSYRTVLIVHPSQSNLENGSIVGSGIMYISGLLNQSMPITQGTVDIGYTFSPVGEIFSAVTSTNDINANVRVRSKGSFFSGGQLNGNLTVNSKGLLSPGGMTKLLGELTVKGNVTLEGGSLADFQFNNIANDKVIIKDGSLYLNQGSSQPILFLEAVQPFIAGTRYVLFDIDPLLEGSGNTIYGTFEVQGFQPLVDLRVQYTDRQVFLGAYYYPFSKIAKTPNQRSIGRALTECDGHTNACLQSKIDQMHIMKIGPLEEIFGSLDPSCFKGGMLALEETLFALNDDIIAQLSWPIDGFKINVGGGYRRINQNSYSQYKGFHTDAGYEYLSLAYGKDNMQMLGAIGGVETNTHYKKGPDNSSTTSIFLDYGYTLFRNRWNFVFDGLFSYNFIHTERTIDFYNLNAHSNHGGFCFKGAFNTSYYKPYHRVNFIPYNTFSFLINQENSFSETGANCLSYHYNSSMRQVIRNDIGLTIEMMNQKKIKPYINVGYVIDYILAGRKYTGQFIDTNSNFYVEGVGPLYNMLKYDVGFLAKSDRFDFRMNLEGLYGNKLKELGASLSGSYRF